MTRERAIDFTRSVIGVILIAGTIFGAGLFFDDRVESCVKENLAPVLTEQLRVRNMESALARVELKLENIEKRLDEMGAERRNNRSQVEQPQGGRNYVRGNRGH